MKILFCSDGSKQAETAVRFGAQIAAGCQAETSILGITSNTRGKAALAQALGRAQDIFREYQLDAEVIAETGISLQDVAKVTAETQYDLVVIGAMCKNPFLRLIDTWFVPPQVRQAYRIMMSVKPPVLVVFCGRPALRRILALTSGDDHVADTMEFTGKIAKCNNAVVDLFHVMQEPPEVYAGLISLEEDADRILESNSRLGRILRRQKDSLERLGVFGRIQLRRGLVVPELLKELQTGDYDLVVSGSAPTEHKLYRYVLGDVTREIVNRAQLPVLVVRSGQRKITDIFKEVFSNLWGRMKKSSGTSQS